MRLERGDWVGLVVALAVAAGCVRLGFWQLDRLRQRRAHNAVVAAARSRPPLVIAGAVAADSARDRRVEASGVYDYGHERLWHGRSYEGMPGVDLLTPLRLADGSAVFVDRGWVPAPDGYHADPRPYREGDSTAVVGLALAAPQGVRGGVDFARLGDSVPYPVLPFVIQQLPPSTALARPVPPGLTRWPAPELSDGPHLSYAIQWFSFAVIIVVGSAALARQRARSRGGTNNTLS